MAAPPIHHYQDRATQRRMVETRVDEGWEGVLTIIATDVPCRFVPKLANAIGDDSLGGHLQYDVPHVMWFAPDFDVRRDDIFTVATRGGRTVRVSAWEESSQLGVFRKATVYEEQEGV